MMKKVLTLFMCLSCLLFSGCARSGAEWVEHIGKLHGRAVRVFTAQSGENGLAVLSSEPSDYYDRLDTIRATSDTIFPLRYMGMEMEWMDVSERMAMEKLYATKIRSRYSEYSSFGEKTAAFYKQLEKVNKLNVEGVLGGFSLEYVQRLLEARGVTAEQYNKLRARNYTARDIYFMTAEDVVAAAEGNAWGRESDENGKERVGDWQAEDSYVQRMLQLYGQRTDYTVVADENGMARVVESDVNRYAEEYRRWLEQEAGEWIRKILRNSGYKVWDVPYTNGELYEVYYNMPIEPALDGYKTHGDLTLAYLKEKVSLENLRAPFYGFSKKYVQERFDALQLTYTEYEIVYDQCYRADFMATRPDDLVYMTREILEQDYLR